MKKFQPPVDSLKPLIEDGTEFRLGSIIKWPKLSELPEEFIIEPFSIKDQIADRKDDACGSCAGAGMIEPCEEAELYYPFLFAAAKHVSGDDPMNFGLTLKDVGKALQKFGVPEVADVPDEVKNLKGSKWRYFENYPESLRQKALKHRAQSYFFIKGYPSDWSPYDAARAAQWYFRDCKQNILFGVVFGWPIDAEYLEGAPNGFGHAMWLGGWNKRGGRAIDSAGKDAGINGVHTISKETFNKYAKDFGMLMVVDIPREEAEYMIENNIKVKDSWLIQLLKVIFPFLNKSL